MLYTVYLITMIMIGNSHLFQIRPIFIILISSVVWNGVLLRDLSRDSDELNRKKVDFCLTLIIYICYFQILVVWEYEIRKVFFLWASSVKEGITLTCLRTWFSWD